MAAEIRDPACQLVIRHVVQEQFQVIPQPSRAIQEPAAHLIVRNAEHPLVLLVAHVIYARAQGFAARAFHQLRQPVPVLCGDHFPAIRLEHLAESVNAYPRDHSVKALTIEVDDPDAPVEVFDEGLVGGLPHAAFVQFSISDVRKKAARNGREVMGRQVVAGQCAEGDRGRSHTDRPGGIVHVVRVLRTAGVRLQTTECPEAFQVTLGKVAQEVLDGVKDRRRMRLDCYPVGGCERLEIKGGEESDRGGGCALVTANLHPIRVYPHVVGPMDHGAGEPQHPVSHVSANVVGVGQLLSFPGWEHFRSETSVHPGARRMRPQANTTSPHKTGAGVRTRMVGGRQFAVGTG